MFGLYKLLALFAGNAISTVPSIGVGACIYGALLLMLRGITKKELLEFPKGKTLYRIASKFSSDVEVWNKLAGKGLTLIQKRRKIPLKKYGIASPFYALPLCAAYYGSFRLSDRYAGEQTKEQMENAGEAVLADTTEKAISESRYAVCGGK